MTTTAEKIRAIRGRLDEVVDETAGIEEIRQEVMAWIRHSLAFQSGIDLGETPPKNWLEVWELDERKNYEEAPRTELLRVDGLPTPAGAILGGRGGGPSTSRRHSTQPSLRVGPLIKGRCHSSTLGPKGSSGACGHRL